jgi:hypothetical protein
VTWTLADLAGHICPAKLRDRRRVALEAADAELRRLIRAGFEQGIPGEQLAQSAMDRLQSAAYEVIINGTQTVFG